MESFKAWLFEYLSKMAEHLESVTSLLARIALEIVSSPLNLCLVAICGFLFYKIVANRRESKPSKPIEPELPKMKKRDFTLEQLREYDGKGPSGRVLVAVNGKVFDCTRGKKFYGPGGPYSAFAGNDASRGLATFSVDAIKNEYDDLSDLNTMQMESVREWEMQFQEKYDYVGRLLKPGEESSEYSDEDDMSQNGKKTGCGNGSKTGDESENKTEDERGNEKEMLDNDTLQDKAKDD